MNSFERLQESQLPTKDAFYTSLTEEDISKTDYHHAQRVFNLFDMAELRDYHNFFLRISETSASNIMILIPPIIGLPLVCSGKLLLKWQTWN